MVAQAMNRQPVDISKMVMPQRPEWNALVPKLPLWFRKRLTALDKNLVPQFFPPAPIGGSRLSAQLFPVGVWGVCRKLPRTGWLWRTWAYKLAEPNGRPRMPNPNDLRLLRIARNLWRREELDTMDRWFDEICEQITKERDDQGVKACYAQAEQICRRMDVARKLNFFSMRNVA